MPRHHLAAASFLLVSLVSTALPAQNLVTDGGFAVADDLASWFGTVGTWELGPDAASCSLSGSAAGTSALVTTDHFLGMYSSHCVAVDPVATPTLHLGASYRTTFNVFARLYLTFFSDAACGSQTGYSAFVFGTMSPDWKRILGPVGLPGTTGSVRVNLDFNPAVSALGPYTGSYDDVYLGVAPELFVDGFEAEGGSTCRWSSVVAGN